MFEAQGTACEERPEARAGTCEKRDSVGKSRVMKRRHSRADPGGPGDSVARLWDIFPRELQNHRWVLI